MASKRAAFPWDIEMVHYKLEHSSTSRGDQRVCSNKSTGPDNFHLASQTCTDIIPSATIYWLFSWNPFLSSPIPSWVSVPLLSPQSFWRCALCVCPLWPTQLYTTKQLWELVRDYQLIGAWGCSHRRISYYACDVAIHFLLCLKSATSSNTELKTSLHFGCC